MNKYIPKVVAAMALSLTTLASSSAPAEPSGVALKMTDYLDSMIQSGVDTIDRLRHSNDDDTAPAAQKPVIAPPVRDTAHLKMDKINSRFVEKNSEIYDTKSKLTWSRCSEGQRWKQNKGCIGTVRQYSFDQAQRLGNETWRLPTTDELATLIDRTKKSTPEDLTIDSVAFPDMDHDKLYYWSSENENNSFAWAVLFIDTGVPSILYRSHRYAVRLVRDGV